MYRFILIYLAIVTKSIAQNYSPDSDKVLIQFDEQNKAFIQHQVVKGQSIFSIRSRYGLSESDFLQFNPQIKERQINMDQWIRIPVGHLMQYETDVAIKENYKAVYYKVQAKENLYSICKNKTQWNPKTLILENKLKESNLKLDQIIKIGYLIYFDSRNTSPIIQSQTKSQEDSTKISLSNLKTETKQQLTNYKNEARGVAISSGSNNGRNYALHNKARKGTWIEIYNPVLERSSMAKVIGKIPKNYSKDIQVVVSASVAENIGAIGNKFFTYIRY